MQLVDKGEQLSKSVLGYESAVLPSSRGFPPAISSKPLNRKSDTSTYRVDEMCPFFCLCLVYIPVAVGAVLRLASRWIHSPLAKLKKQMQLSQLSSALSICVSHANHYMFANCPTMSREHNRGSKDENREALGHLKASAHCQGFPPGIVDLWLIDHCIQQTPAEKNSICFAGLKWSGLYQLVGLHD